MPEKLWLLGQLFYTFLWQEDATRSIATTPSSPPPPLFSNDCEDGTNSSNGNSTSSATPHLPRFHLERGDEEVAIPLCVLPADKDDTLSAQRYASSYP